jgi:radical SAM superfamily enzyme YgiQ (UPF0313 family)
MKIEKILLINPSAVNKIEFTSKNDLRPDKMGAYPPLGLLYIASFLKKNTDYIVSILDLGYSANPEQLLKNKLLEYNPEVIGFTLYPEIWVDALSEAKLCKEILPECIIVGGGPQTQTFPKETLAHKEFDFLIRGEGEESFSNLLFALEKNKSLEDVAGLVYKKNNIYKHSEPAVYSKDLDTLPIPDLTLINLNDYYCILGSEKNVASVVSSRGCPYNCIFCSNKFKKYRRRSNENILLELEQYVNRGIKEIMFFDDNFNFYPELVIDFAEKLKEKNWGLKWSFRGRADSLSDELLKKCKEAGCERIQLGIETSSNEKLKYIKKSISVETIYDAIKRINCNGIISVGNFILGLPCDKNKNDIYNTINFAINSGLKLAEFHLLKLFPDTELYQNAIEHNMVDENKWKDFILNPKKEFKPDCWTEYFKMEELEKFIKEANHKFYFRPKLILNQLLSMRSFDELIRKFKGFLYIFNQLF